MGGGGGFSLGRFLDPLGVIPGVGKGKPGSFLDPANLFGKDKSPAEDIASTPVPTPATAVTPNNQAVVQAEHDYTMANMLKKSVRKTIVAGDTGGYSPANPNGTTGQQQGYKARLG